MKFKGEQLKALKKFIENAMEIAFDVSSIDRDRYNAATSLLDRGDRFLRLINMSEYVNSTYYQFAEEIKKSPSLIKSLAGGTSWTYE